MLSNKIALCQNKEAMKAKSSRWGQMPTTLVKVSQRKAIKKGLVPFFSGDLLTLQKKLFILPMEVPQKIIIIIFVLWLKPDDGEKETLLFIVLGNLLGVEQKSAVSWLKQNVESSQSFCMCIHSETCKGDYKLLLWWDYKLAQDRKKDWWSSFLLALVVWLRQCLKEIISFPVDFSASRKKLKSFVLAFLY